MEGSRFLRVTGVLMIIFASVALVAAVFAVIGIGILAAGDVPIGRFIVTTSAAFLGAVAEFVTGILGVKNWDHPERANVCIGWGITVIALSLIADALVFAFFPEYFQIASIAIGLIIPILYLLGSFQNRKLARKQEDM